MTNPPPPPIPICETCGQQHVTKFGKPSCGAHLNSEGVKGQPCKNPLGYQTDHAGAGNCRKHGGLLPNLKKHAQKELLEAEVQKQLGLDEWDPITDPFQALASAAGKAEKMETI